MICVLADDLTGAAEIAGIGLRHRLTAEVLLDAQPNPQLGADFDLVCIDTDSRACEQGEAASRSAQAGAWCRREDIEQVFKKVDSLMRGHVRSELEALMRSLGMARALLVPANPGRSRVIRAGRYYVDGIPLDSTELAMDPDYPLRSADLVSLLGPTGTEAISVLHPSAEPPSHGIVVGEASCSADLTTWAQKLDRSTLPAGAAEFFGAFLEAHGLGGASNSRSRRACRPEGKALFVCGSTAASSRSFCRWWEEHGLVLLRMPAELFRGTQRADGFVEQWADRTIRALARQPSALMAIDHPLRRDPGLPGKLGDHLAAAVDLVLKGVAVDHLLVEGGATAIAVARRLGCRRWMAREELAPGVVCLQGLEGSQPLLTIKPGSYAWPGTILPEG